MLRYLPTDKQGQGTASGKGSLEPQGPDFGELAIRLAGYALRVFGELHLGGRTTTIAGLGVSVEDFVGNVLAEYVEGRLVHESARGDLFSLLAAAMRNDIIDALRKAAHAREDARRSLPREEKRDGSPSLDELPAQAIELVARMDEERFRKRVRDAFRNEPELAHLVTAVLEQDLTKPQEIAAALGISTEEVHNRKKKLRRRLVEYGFVRRELR